MPNTYYSWLAQSKNMKTRDRTTTHRLLWFDQYLASTACAYSFSCLLYQPFLITHSTAVLGLVFDSAIVFLSGGVPYWYYCFAHPRFPHDRERELGESASATILNYEEHWSNKVPQIFKVWKTHRLIVGAVLALVDSHNLEVELIAVQTYVSPLIGLATTKVFMGIYIRHSVSLVWFDNYRYLCLPCNLLSRHWRIQIVYCEHGLSLFFSLGDPLISLFPRYLTVDFFVERFYTSTFSSHFPQCGLRGM